MPVAATRRSGAESRGASVATKKQRQKKAGTQEEMSFVAKLDPSVAYHPSMVAELRKLGVILEERIPKKKNKVPITIRLDPDIVEALRDMGEGWQPKTNDLLRKWLKLDRAS